MRICERCEGCRRDDCGKCEECLNMEKFGGDGTLMLDCKHRVCSNRSSGPRKRCGTCDGCTREDCGKCFECKHKSKFGGNGTSRQVCMARHCFVHGGLTSRAGDVTPNQLNSAKKMPSVKEEAAASTTSAAAGSTTSATAGISITGIESEVNKRSTQNPFTVASLARVPPPPTRISTRKKQIFPNVQEEHTQWARAMEPKNKAPLGAAESLKARTTKRPPRVVKKLGDSSLMTLSFMGATPASSETKNKLHNLRKDIGIEVQTVSDEGEESEKPHVSDHASEEDDEDKSPEEGDDDSGEETESEVAPTKLRTGRWSHDERLLFLHGLQKYGSGNWVKVAEIVPSRNSIQVKSFAQNIRVRQERGENIFQPLSDCQERLQLLLEHGLDAESLTRDEDDYHEHGHDADAEDDTSQNESSDNGGDEEEEHEQFSTPPSSGKGQGDVDQTVFGEDVFFDCSEDLAMSSPAKSVVTNNSSSETHTSAGPMRCATAEEIASFYKRPELVEEYAVLSEYNKMLLEHIEMFRATQADVDKGRGRWKLSINQIGFRCKLCGQADRKQNCSSSFPGRIEIMDMSFYIIAMNHINGTAGSKETKECPLLSAEVRRNVRMAQEDSRSYCGKRGKKVDKFLKKLVEECGIVQTNHGLKLRSDLDPGDKVIGEGVARAKSMEKRRRPSLSQTPRKRTRTSIGPRRKQSRAAPSSSPRRQRRPATPERKPRKAQIISKSRASRSLSSRAFSSYVQESNYGRKMVYYDSPTLTSNALQALAPAFDSFIQDAIENPSAYAVETKTSGSLDFLAGTFSDQPIVKDIPPPRLSEETKNEVESSKYRCKDCEFPIEGHAMQFFPYTDLVHLEKNNSLCEGCRSHFSAATEMYLKKRETKLVDPWSPQIFPAPIFRVGGVSEEFMSYFLSLKLRLTASKARMKDFGRIPATGGQGKFQYLVGDKSEAERRWQWQDCRLLQNAPLETKAIETFALDHVAAQLPLGRDGYRIDPGFVMTHKAVVQGPHRDFQGYDYLYNQKEEFENICDRPETQLLPFVLHCPLCKEGMELNYWPETRKSAPPIRIHIPFGTFLLTRVDAVHGGIFGSQGNIRLHIAYTPMAEAIAVKGKELQLQHSKEKLSNESIQRHVDLGATVAGQHQRKLDLLKDDISKYRDPRGVDDCDRNYPIAYEEPGYAQRLLQRNRLVWDASMLDNISAEHLFL